MASRQSRIICSQVSPFIRVSTFSIPQNFNISSIFVPHPRRVNSYAKVMINYFVWKANLATSAAGWDVPERALILLSWRVVFYGITTVLNRKMLFHTRNRFFLIKSNPSSSITCMDHVHLYLMRQGSALLKLLTSNYHHQLKHSMK